MSEASPSGGDLRSGEASPSADIWQRNEPPLRGHPAKGRGARRPLLSCPPFWCPAARRQRSPQNVSPKNWGGCPRRCKRSENRVLKPFPVLVRPFDEVRPPS